jgi:hypothetical protein
LDVPVSSGRFRGEHAGHTGRQTLWSGCLS